MTVIDLEIQEDGSYTPLPKAKSKHGFKNPSQAPPNPLKREDTKLRQPNKTLNKVSQFLDGVEDGLEMGERLVSMYEKYTRKFRRSDYD